VGQVKEVTTSQNTALGKAAGHIFGLDGLRAFAVLAVVFYHLFPTLLPGGYIGVDIFFVVSGFLITTLLIGEQVKKGKINLKQFWIRRARRLLPALFITILIISSIVFFIRGDIMVGIGQQILGASTFSSNWMEVISGTNYFSNSTTHLFMNFWSLAVEEQFYLVWPFFVLLLVSIIKKPGIGMFVTALFSLASAGLMAWLFLHGVDQTRLYYGTDTHIFGLMLGAFVAFWSHSLTKGQAYRRHVQYFWVLRRTPRFVGIVGILALGGVSYLIATLSDRTPFTYLGGLFLASFLTALVLIATINRRGFLQKLFTWQPLEWIGSRSYGIYLWHWPLLVVLRYLLPATLPEWVLPCLVVPLTFSIAELSFRYVETPIRQYGFGAILKRAILHYHPETKNILRIRHRPRVAAVAICLAVVLTVIGVVNAPTKTSAQLNIEAGQRAIAAQKKLVASKPIAAKQPKAAPAPPLTGPIDGNNISAIGDSVMLASTVALQTKFPGIAIDAEVSRSLRDNGFDVIDALKASGQLRPIVVVALGTNGYYGTGSLDMLVDQLKGHTIILVTAHADREWIAPNNNDARAIASTHKNIALAEWDQAISSHPELLSSDGIHPFGDGDTIYADSIDTAIRHLPPPHN
jgi:peptidoglycan/LPS O-acetylase OafA/YrhL